MKLENHFHVAAKPESVWETLLDPARVAPCMPGASVDTVEQNEFTGSVKVKIGAATLVYQGSGQFVSIDPEAHRLVMKAAGTERRGNGRAVATVTVTLEDNDGHTDGTVNTDLNLRGRAAQFGRGMVTEIAGKLLEEFAARLARAV